MSTHALMNHVIDCLEPLVDGIFLLIRDNEEAVALVLFNPYSWTVSGQRWSPFDSLSSFSSCFS